MKDCPYCAEQVQDAAIKCKHCGEMIGSCPIARPNPYAGTPSGTRSRLDEGSRSSAPAGGRTRKSWSTTVLVLGLSFVGICVVALAASGVDAGQSRIEAESAERERTARLQETRRRQAAANAEFERLFAAACRALTSDDVDAARAGFERCREVADFVGSKRRAEQGVLVCAALADPAGDAVKNLVASWSVAELNTFQESERTPAETPTWPAAEQTALSQRLKSAVDERVTFLVTQQREFEVRRAKASRSAASLTLDAVPWEVKLAAFDGHSFDGRAMTDEHGRLASNRIRYLLGEIERKTGTPPNRIADITVAGRDSLRKRFGKDLSHQDIMENVNSAIPEDASGIIKYEEAAAAYIVLYGR